MRLNCYYFLFDDAKIVFYVPHNTFMKLIKYKYIILCNI
nr:MAG TPA: hypothetical protein [Caudoviricetes sp.]